MPDSNASHYAVTIQDKPLTQAEAIVNMHIQMFGHTGDIMAGEGRDERPEQIERLQKIAEMLKWNKDKIDNCNEALKDRRSWVNLFEKRGEVQNKLRFHHQVRERLKSMWRGQLERMKD